MGALSISDIAQFFNLAEHVRPWLPWTWRVYATTWLIWSGILFVAAVLTLIVHFVAQAKPLVDWHFLKDARPFIVNYSTDNGQISSYRVDTFQLRGENVSGHALHQIAGKITLADKRELPLYIIADGQWVQTDQIEPIGRLTNFTLGAQFRTDTLHWRDFQAPLTPEQFVQAFGGSTAAVTIDGREQSWVFSVEDLRHSFEKQRKEAEDNTLRMMRQEVHRKKTQ